MLGSRAKMRKAGPGSEAVVIGSKCIEPGSHAKLSLYSLTGCELVSHMSSEPAEPGRSSLLRSEGVITSEAEQSRTRKEAAKMAISFIGQKRLRDFVDDRPARCSVAGRSRV